MNTKLKTLLAIDTVCMASDDAVDWRLRYYAGDYTCFEHGVPSIIADAETYAWNFIIPADKFDFNDPCSNKKSLYNYGFATDTTETT